MVPKDIQRVLRQLSVLADEWAASGNIAPIERDLALDKLRMLYEALRLSDVVAAEFPATDEGLEFVHFDLDDVLSVDRVEQHEDPAPEVEIVSIPEAKPEVEAETEVKTAFEAETAVAVEMETEVEPEAEIEIELAELSGSSDIAEPEPSPFEELTIEPVQSEFAQPEKPQRALTAKSAEIPAPTLFGTDEVDGMFRHRQKQRVLMSLYDIDEPHSAPPASEIETENRTEPDSAPQPVDRNPASTVYEPASVEDELVMEEIEIGGEEDQSWKDEVSEFEPEEVFVAPRVEFSAERETVLGDVMNHHVQTLGDTLGAQDRTASEAVHGERISDLRKVIGINDRFLMIRDLFAGDAEAFDLVIGEINAFDDLDDCMIHLAENYAWNPNSDGAKLLMELITRKLA